VSNAEPADTWVIIPSYNDGEPLGDVLAQLAPFRYSVVVVDDGSKVPVAQSVSRPGVRILRHCVNLGQGAAIQTGIDFALKSGAKYLVTFDADGQHLADEIELLLEPLRSGRAEVALGTRFGGGGRAINISRGRTLTLKLGTLWSRRTTGLDITDTHNGFRALSRRAAGQLRITQNRMAHASQILEEIARLAIPYVEVPVTIRYTEYSIAKGQKLSNAMNILWESISGKFS